MEKAPLYASLHSAIPTYQTEHEISYPGYERQSVDYDKQTFGQRSRVIEFAQIVEAIEGPPISYIAIGTNKDGDGEIIQVIECLPYVDLFAGTIPRVIVANIPEPLPAEIHPLASVLWHMWNSGQLPAEKIPHALYEALNNELARVGVDVIPVIREGTARMEAKFSTMKSFSLEQNSSPE